MSLESLFADHTTLRAVIDSVLEERLGRAVRDDPARPRAARLDVGCYSIFGGDPHAPGAARLVGQVQPPVELIGPERQPWRDLFVAVHGARLSDRPMRTFSSHALDRERLRGMAAAVPGGFELRRFDAFLARQLGSALIPHALQTFPSAERFAEQGLGFGVLQADRLVSAATSYTRSDRSVEIAMSTHAELRGRGLARVAAAALIGECLDSGLRPDWSASNPVSKRLALALGYLPGRLCDVFFLEAAGGASASP